MLFINLSKVISGVMLPKMSKMIVDNATDEEISNEFIKVVRIQYFIIFLVFSGLILFGKEFIIWWVGREYKLSYYITLIIPISFPLIQNLGISILQAKGLYKFKAILTFLMAVVNILISTPLAKLYGWIGSAMGTALFLIIANIIIIKRLQLM